MILDRAAALTQLRAAAASFRQRGLRSALNTMVAARAERLAAMATMSASATAFVNRSLLRSWRKLSAVGRLRGIAKRAARSLLHRNLRRGHNGWVSMILDRAAALTQLRAAAVSFRQRGLRSALNTMIAAYATRLALRSCGLRAASALMRRAHRHALNRWSQLLADGSAARRIWQVAGSSWLLRGQRAAFNGLVMWRAEIGRAHV